MVQWYKIGVIEKVRDPSRAPKLKAEVPTNAIPEGSSLFFFLFFFLSLHYHCYCYRYHDDDAADDDYY